MAEIPQLTDIDPKGKPVRDMPAGHKRNEQLKINSDRLAERAETEFADAGALDPNKFQSIDNEIACHYDDETGTIPVTKKQPGFVYSWVLCRGPATIEGAISSAHVALKRVGWVPVTGNMPEAEEHRATDSTRVVGDVMLYRIPVDRYWAVFNKLQAVINQQQIDGPERSFIAQGARFRGRVGSNPAAAAHSGPNATEVQVRMEDGRLISIPH